MTMTGGVTQDAFRPTSWDQLIGQAALKERLEIHIQSAKKRSTRLDHVLLIGPPGSGKTSIASLIASELDQKIHATVMPIEAMMVFRLMREFKGVAFLDELHRSKPAQQEVFLPIIEDGYYQLRDGRRVYNHDLTFLAATTEPEKIIAPLFDRFPVNISFDPYSEDEMAAIVGQMARKTGVPLLEGQPAELGKATAGIPRAAKALIIMARDLGITLGRRATTQEILETARITPDGLTIDHLRYLQALDKLGGVAGLENLSTQLRLPIPYVRELERTLIDQEKIMLTGRGRQLNFFGEIPS